MRHPLNALKYILAVLAGLLFACSICADAQSPIFFQTTFTSAQVANPSFSPSSPYTGGSTTVTITDSTPSSTILYCVDTTNSCTPTTTYTAGLSFTSTEFIRAYATASGFNPSPVVSWSGTFVNLPTVLQSSISAADCTGGTCTATLPSHAAGGLSCVLASYKTGTVDTNLPVNTAGFTWTKVSTTAFSVSTQEAWCAPKTAFGSTDTVTVTFPASTFHGGIVFLDASVVSSVDVSNSAVSSTTSTPTVTLSSLTGSNDLILAFGRGSIASTQGSGYTCLTCGGSGYWGGFDVAEWAVASGSTATATLAPGNQNPWSMLGVALK